MSGTYYRDRNNRVTLFRVKLGKILQVKLALFNIRTTTPVKLAGFTILF